MFFYYAHSSMPWSIDNGETCTMLNCKLDNLDTGIHRRIGSVWICVVAIFCHFFFSLQNIINTLTSFTRLHPVCLLTIIYSCASWGLTSLDRLNRLLGIFPPLRPSTAIIEMKGGHSAHRATVFQAKTCCSLHNYVEHRLRQAARSNCLGGWSWNLKSFYSGTPLSSM